MFYSTNLLKMISWKDTKSKSIHPVDALDITVLIGDSFTHVCPVSCRGQLVVIRATVAVPETRVSAMQLGIRHATAKNTLALDHEACL